MKSIRAIPTVEEVKMADLITDALENDEKVWLLDRIRIRKIILESIIDFNRQEIEEKPNGK